jgi:CBS-domain-containing membrane protein
MTTVKARADTLRPGLYAALLCLVTLAIAGAVGLVLHRPWLFPSLGPTVMLCFDSPEHPTARPRNTIIGHAVGIAVGYGCLVTFGLVGHPSAAVAGLTARHVAAGSMSVALTTLLLRVLRCPHPPAGATTLIVSLGILATPRALAAMFAAVLLITAVGWGANRLRGVRPAPLGCGG